MHIDIQNKLNFFLHGHIHIVISHIILCNSFHFTKFQTERDNFLPVKKPKRKNKFKFILPQITVLVFLYRFLMVTNGLPEWNSIKHPLPIRSIGII